MTMVSLTANSGTTHAWYYPNIPSNFQFNKDLLEGMTDNDVRYLQIMLNADPATRLNASAGQAGSPGNETTFFGSLTKDAAIRFQQKHGISSTGYVGTQTRTRLNALLQEHQRGHVIDVWWPTDGGEVPDTVVTSAVVTNMGDDPTRYLLGVYVEQSNQVILMSNSWQDWPHKQACLRHPHMAD